MRNGGEPPTDFQICCCACRACVINQSMSTDRKRAHLPSRQANTVHHSGLCPLSLWHLFVGYAL